VEPLSDLITPARAVGLGHHITLKAATHVLFQTVRRLPTVLRGDSVAAYRLFRERAVRLMVKSFSIRGDLLPAMYLISGDQRKRGRR
jgi:hypothetical protein